MYILLIIALYLKFIVRFDATINCKKLGHVDFLSTS